MAQDKQIRNIRKAFFELLSPIFDDYFEPCDSTKKYLSNEKNEV